MAKRKKILIIDDEENMRHVLMAILEKEGYDTVSAADGLEGLAMIDQHDFDAILCDLRMPKMDGMEFLKKISGRNISSTIITMSAYGTIDLAIETMKRGAYDYISKPFKPAEIILALKKAEERRQLKKENIVLRRAVEEKYGFDNLIGKSRRILSVFEIITKVANVKSSVLITGESGTGKELAAKAIHYNSPRKSNTFLAINCGAIPETLLESELFGHKKGSFTGACHDRKGFFEEADKGTLLLDEIGDISANLQVKLLRVLQEGEIRRIGEEHSVSVDVRVIAATAKDLMQEVKKGLFREDLYYRLNVLPVHIPSLRERKEDIPVLVEHFIKKYNEAHGLAVDGITPSALKILISCNWPGNIRELENIIERSMVLSEKKMLDADDMPEDIRASQTENIYDVSEDEYSIKKAARVMEQKLIRKALNKAHGNKSRAAKLLELSYPALLSKIIEYNIS
jgi:two-component system, NtrC family, response regulator AtoC